MITATWVIIPTETNKTMIEFFKGKNVSLVGPADYLELFRENSENLKKIESADVVVKLNSGINLSTIYPELVSKRIDILYNSLLDNCVNGGVLSIEDIVNANIRHIRTTPKSSYSGFADRQDTTNITSKKTYNKLLSLSNDHRIDTSIMNIELYNTVSKNVKSKPTTGFVTIYDILMYNPKSLYITGFNFFMSPPLKGYWGGGLDGSEKIPHKFTVAGEKKEVFRTEEEHAAVVSNSKRHVHEYMWRYAKNTLLSKDNVSFDPILEKFLLVENFSKENYNKILKDYVGGVLSE